jgi:hypothetical protein
MFLLPSPFSPPICRFNPLHACRACVCVTCSRCIVGAYRAASFSHCVPCQGLHSSCFKQQLPCRISVPSRLLLRGCIARLCSAVCDLWPATFARCMRLALASCSASRTLCHKSHDGSSLADHSTRHLLLTWRINVCAPWLLTAMSAVSIVAILVVPDEQCPEWHFAAGC